MFRVAAKPLPGRAPPGAGVVVVTKVAPSSLQALTAAALLLPGLVCRPARSDEGDEVAFQYGRYQEGDRKLFSVPNSLKPIAVDSLRGVSRITLGDENALTVSFSQDTWSGATPITTAPLTLGGNRPIQTGPPGHLITVGASPMINGRILLDRQYQPVQIDPATGKSIVQDQRVHTLSSASPETRRQMDFQLTHRLDSGRLELGGGASSERDYESRFINLGRRWDINQNLTTISLALSHTQSDTAATLDHDAAPYITKTAYMGQIDQAGTAQILRGHRRDWSATAGLTQVLAKGTLLETSLGYTHGTGYLANPYKVMSVVFADPASVDTGSGVMSGDVRALLEQRPKVRNQWTMGGRIVQAIPSLDAALHLGYQFHHDDWGVNAHTVEADWGQPLGNGWVLTPRLRYYSQSAAHFYSAYLVSGQAYKKVVAEPDGQYTLTPFDPGLLPAYFSSDQRLSAFGALSGGLGIAKPIARGVSLEAGIEYYRHAGGLKLGGGGEDRYADFSSYLANVVLKWNLDEIGNASSSSDREERHDQDSHSHGHPYSGMPAGIMAGHFLDHPGDVMVGYRYLDSRDGGEMLHGSGPVADVQILTEGCGNKTCYIAPTRMRMHMQMLDLGVAVTEGFNLMLMPQYLDMKMTSRGLDGAPPAPLDTPVHTGTHETGGMGDTSLQALIKLHDSALGRLLLTLGISAPTGDTGIKPRRSHQQEPGYTHYGMQLGSGTWDFQPALTYLGQNGHWAWGGQASGTLRLESRNPEGFSLGDAFQVTAWVSHPVNTWLSASLRGVYSAQGAIRGEYNSDHAQSAPMDFPGNYGGQFWDVGLGATAQVPVGAYRGSTLGMEWLWPVSTQVNGYQLDRNGSLVFNWSYHF
ncbi:DUF3570 domain-containing protein [Gammaproteobacteria bacterium]